MQVRAEVYEAMLERIGVPEIFAFLGEVSNEYLCACLMRAIVSNFPVNDASVQEALSHPVIQSPDFGDSDTEMLIPDEEEAYRMAEFVEDNAEKISVKFLPWKEREYSNDSLMRLSNVASILSKFYEIPARFHRQNMLNNLCTKYSYEISQWKRNYPAVVKKIDERAINFKLDLSAKYRNALAFLFRYFISVLVSKMRTAGDKQSVAVKGKAFISPGSLHANGRKTEFSTEGGSFVCVNSERSVFLSNDRFEGKELSKEMWLPWLPVWPRGVVGLITKSLGDSTYVVQLCEDKETLFKVLDENGIDRPDDPSFGLWKWTEGTGVRVCSPDMTCLSNMCAFCHNVTVGKKCICRSLETRKMYAFYMLEYEGESYRIRFEEAQVVYINPAIFRRSNSGKKGKPIIAYIEKIVGPMLHLRTCFFKSLANLRDEKFMDGRQTVSFRAGKQTFHDGRQKAVELHFLDPNLNVPLQGRGPIHTMKKYEFSKQCIFASLISKHVDLLCSQCNRGPKLGHHGCNWCGTSHIGYEVKVDTPVAPEESWREFSSFFDGFIKDVSNLNIACSHFFLEQRPGVPAPVSSYDDAKILHDRIKSMCTEFRGTFEIKLRSSSVQIFRSDKEYEDFFSLYDKCEQSSRKADYAMKTMNSSFAARLSTWVQDKTVLKERKDEEIDVLCARMTKQQRHTVVDQLLSMASNNDVISGMLETRAIHASLHDPYFPFVNTTSRVEADFSHEHAVRYALQGLEYTVTSKLSVEKRFNLCRCRTVAFHGTSNMMCSGPLMGIDVDREREIRNIINFQDEGSFYREQSEEQASFYFLTRIHKLDLENNMEQIFVLYIFCMFMWYAFSAKTFEVTAPRKLVPRGKSCSFISEAADKLRSDLLESGGTINFDLPSDHCAMFDLVRSIFNDVSTPEPRDTKKLGWYQRFKTAPYADFVDLFYGASIPSDYAYCGPAPKKCRTGTEIEIPSQQKIADLLEMSISFVEASLPFNSAKVFHSTSKIDNSIRLWDMNKKGLSSKAAMKELYPKFKLTLPTFEFYREMWVNIHNLGVDRTECRSETEFLRILRGYEMLQPPMKREISAVLCPNEACEQCEILSLLKSHCAGQPVRGMRKLKSFCNADRQIKAFGEWVDFQICSHSKKFSECWTCLQAYKPCRKNELCVRGVNGMLCLPRRIANLDMFDGSCVQFVDPNFDCMELRYSQDRKRGLLREEDGTTSSLPFRSLIFTNRECRDYDLFRPGSAVDDCY